MAQIFLVRHGKKSTTDFNSILSKKGKLQASYLSNRFKTIKLTKIYVSTMLRALQTAKPALKYHTDIPIITTDLLSEVHASLVGGKIGRDIGRARIDRKRANQVFDEIFTKAKRNDRILVVCHGNIIKYFLKKILRINKFDLWRYLQIHSSGVSLIEGYKDEWSIRTINNIDHLNKIHKSDFYNKKYEIPKE